MLSDRTIWRLIPLVFALALILTGCGASFDHAAYVGALLDASYKAEFDEYVRLTKTSPERAREQYDQNLEAIVNDICEALGADVSPEHREKLAVIMENVLKASSYDVTGAEMVTEREYSVGIKIRPITNFIYMESEIAAFTEDFINALENGDGRADADVIFNEFMDGLTSILEKGTETITYGGEMEISVPVILDEELERWRLPDEDQENIFNCIISV